MIVQNVKTSIALGHSDLKVHRIGLGCMGMSEFYGASVEASNIETLRAAFDLGVDFFDTADMYGAGHNEILLGKAFAGRWDQLVLATKFGVVRGEDGSWRGINCSPAYVKQACEQSLRRLGVECIDLYYMHRPDPQVPIEDTVGAMSDLVKSGKVRYLGLSEVNANLLRRAHRVHPISALQTEFSLWTREPFEEIIATCRELGVTYVAYSPIGRGFLSGQVTRESLDSDDWRLELPRFQVEALRENQVFLEILRDIAREKRATPAQVALTWVLQQAPNLVAIPGTRKISRLQENLAAFEFELTDDELDSIRSRLPKTTFGERYPDS